MRCIPPAVSWGVEVVSVEQHLASVQLYNTPAVFERTSDARLKGTIFAQVGWDKLLVGVNLHKLCQTVANPSPKDIVYHRLTEAVERYYASLPPLIPPLPILTAHAVLSSGELAVQTVQVEQTVDVVSSWCVGVICRSISLCDRQRFGGRISQGSILYALPAHQARYQHDHE